MPDITEELVVRNSKGIHARPAAQLVKTTLGFQCETYISFNGYRVNAKSIMGILTLAAVSGTRLSVTCSGSDAIEAMSALRRLFDSGFGEE